METVSDIGLTCRESQNTFLFSFFSIIELSMR